MGQRERDQPEKDTLIEASVEWEGTLLAVGHFAADLRSGGLDAMALEGMAREGISLGDMDSVREVLGRLAPGDVERVGPLSLSLRYVTSEEPAPRKAIAWAPLAYVSFAMVLAGFFLALLALVPADGHTFSIADETQTRRAVPFATLAPELLFDEAEGERRDDTDGAEWGQQGLAGVEAPDLSPRRRSERTSDVVTPRAAAERSGVLSLGAIFEGLGASNSPFEHALGQDADAMLGALTGSAAGESFGFGGLAMRGTGRHGGGEGLGTIPLVERFGLRGSSGGTCGCEGSLMGSIGMIGGLGASAQLREGDSDTEPVRTARVPHLRSTGPEVRGSLDPEVIRRVVRRHTSETRHCYEQALRSRPDLEGRVEAQFIIDPRGAVTAASLRSSTIAHSEVEACVLNVVRRMTFPATPHGNISIVSYPWVFSVL